MAPSSRPLLASVVGGFPEFPMTGVPPVQILDIGTVGTVGVVAAQNVGFAPLLARTRQTSERRSMGSFRARSASAQARRGENLIRGLGPAFIDANRGKFVAISMTGSVLVLASTLTEALKGLRDSPPRSDYYLTQVGEGSLGASRAEVI